LICAMRSFTNFILMIMISGACFLALLPVPVHALTPAQVFAKVKDAVVVVKRLDAQGKVKAQGSGVILSSGRVATNCHVVEGGISYRVGRGKHLVSAILYAEDRDKDICLLDAKGIQGKPVQLGKAAGLKVGDPVYAVGAPEGLELSLSDGVVAQLRVAKNDSEEGWDSERLPLIQTTAAISPGSSGGGLFDGEGRLVGLTTFYLEGGQSLNFAMPAEWIREVKPGRTTVAESHSDAELTVAESHSDDEWFGRAFEMEMGRDWEGLLDWCLKWTISRPENAIAWTDLGEAYAGLNRHDDAIKAYQQAVKIDAKYAWAWYKLGTAYEDLKRYNEAIEVWRQNLRINPDAELAWQHLGVAYGMLKRYNDGVEACRQAVMIRPQDGDAWTCLVDAYEHLNRHDEAVEAHNQAASRYDNDIEAYRQAIKTNPENDDAWRKLGATYELLNRHDDAIEAFRQCVRSNPDNDMGWLWLGSVYRHLKRYDDAIEAYRQAIKPNPVSGWSGLGSIYEDLKRYDDAVKAYRQVDKILPENASALRDLGRAYALSGNKTAAMDVVRKLRRLNRTTADELFNLIVPR